MSLATSKKSMISTAANGHHFITRTSSQRDTLYSTDFTMASISTKIATIEAVETLIQYKFNHSALLWEALQCPSSPNSTHPNGNKRLAIIGDTVIQLSLAEDWFSGDGTTGTKGVGALKPEPTSAKTFIWGSSVLTQNVLLQAIGVRYANPSLRTQICDGSAWSWVLIDSLV